MTSTENRRNVILSIVAQGTVGTQDDLVEQLHLRGIEASQASISRDIAALGLVKINNVYVRRADIANDPAGHADPRLSRLSSHVLSVSAAGPHLVVLRTPPGEASGCALALDSLGWDGVVGTIAGDDTIFVATESERACDELVGKLRRIAKI